MSIKGFNNQKAHGQSNHVTVQSSGSDKHGIPTAQIYLYDLTAVLTVASAVLSGDEKEITITLSAAHSARVGDIIRLLSGAITGWEYEIKEIVSATAVKVWKTSSSIPATGINVKACRWITAKADSEGALTTASGPIQFTRNGATETVTEDTVTPSNNRPLPVKLTGVTGDLTITAQNLNIQSTHTGANPDSMQIGDGTDLLAVNADGSLNIGASALPTGAATLTEQQTQSARLGDVVEVAPATDTASSGINGRLQRIAQRLSSLISLLPISLGQKTSAASLAVVLPSDQTVPVSGTFWQATQPVSGPLTDAQLRAVAVPVSGTFWQATQPVSGTFFQATQPVSIASAAPEAVRVASYQEIAALTTVQTITAPANVKWFKIMNIGAESIRLRMGGVAVTATTGMRLEAGRSEDFSVSGDISVISESGISTSLAVIYGV